MRYPSRRCLALSLTLLASAAVADQSGSGSGTTTYRWVDAQGVVHYSDTPQPGAQRVVIQPAQTFRDAGAQSRSESAPAPPQAAAAYQVCSITQPAAEQSLYSPESLAVTVRLTPALRPGDQLTVTLDGESLAPVEEGGLSFQAANPARGAHSVQAVVRDADGRTLCTAPAVTFYVQRPSLLSPLSPAAREGGTTSSPVPVH